MAMNALDADNRDALNRPARFLYLDLPVAFQTSRWGYPPRQHSADLDILTLLIMHLYSNNSSKYIEFVSLLLDL